MGLMVRILLTGVGLALLLAPGIALPDQEFGPLDPKLVRITEKHAHVVDLQAYGILEPSDRDGPSRLVVLEDGQPLPLGHQMHVTIQKEGAGRYSHWDRNVYFSASDNSDPATNGRSYLVRVPHDLGRAAAQGLAGLLGKPTLGVPIHLALTWGSLAAGSVLVVLCWCPLTWLPRGKRLDWLRARAAWTVGFLGFLALIGWGLVGNWLDVTTRTAQVLHGGLVVLLLGMYLMYLFQKFLMNRRYGFDQHLGWPVRWTGKAFTGLVGCWCLALAAEALLRVFPVVSSMAVNPGCIYFWPDYFEPRNSLEMPDREPGAKWGPRILVLGDSYTQGAGVPKDCRYSNRLERQLRRQDPTIEVFNAGQCGLDTYEEADVLDRLGDLLQPDIVVVGYCLNDADGEAPPSRDPAPWLDHHLLGKVQSYAYYRLKCWLATWVYQGREATSVEQTHQECNPGWLRAVKGMQRIAAWCDQRQVRKVLMVFPYYAPGADSARPVMEQVAAAAVAAGFQARNTLDDFGGRWAELAISPWDTHPNREAHAILAEKLETMIGTPALTYRTPKSEPWFTLSVRSASRAP